MKGLSKKEIELIASLEFDEKYFFTSADVDLFAKNKIQRYNLIKNLLKKKRIIKLNRTKYILIPIKAKGDYWSEDGFILADEMCDGKNYVIGGYAAANYWRLSDQIPFQVDVYTTRRQGKKKIMNTRIVFHRTTAKKVKSAEIKTIQKHACRIMSKEETKKWMRSLK